MRQTLNLLPILGSALIRKVFAGCCQPLLRKGPSQRCFCRPSLRAGTPTPAAPKVLSPVSSPGTLAFPLRTAGRRLATLHQLLQMVGAFGAAVISLRSGPQVCSPPQVAPTLTRLCMSGSRDFYGRAYHGCFARRGTTSLGLIPTHEERDARTCRWPRFEMSERWSLLQKPEIRPRTPAANIANVIASPLRSWSHKPG
jgi:hypothetical protein